MQHRFFAIYYPKRVPTGIRAALKAGDYITTCRQGGQQFYLFLHRPIANPAIYLRFITINILISINQNPLKRIFRSNLYLLKAAQYAKRASAAVFSLIKTV